VRFAAVALIVGVATLVAILISSERGRRFPLTPVTATLIAFVLSLGLTGSAGQAGTDFVWIPSLNIHYHVAIDGKTMRRSFDRAAVASPLHLSDSPQAFNRLPAVGQDTDAILRGAGYSDAEIAKFRQEKVI
jgi:hypothetical protein